MRTSLHDTILDYLDGKLTPAEKSEFEQRLANDAQLKKQVEEFRVMENMIRAIKPEQPSKDFTRNVIANLDNYSPARSFPIRNGILMLMGIITVSALCVLLLSIGVFDSAIATIDLDRVGVQTRYIERALPSISLDGKLFVNIVVLLNLAIAFIVLDRTILQPYFRRRMHL